MRRLGWIIVIPLAVIAIVFAVNNNAPVEIDFWPLPWRVPLPLFAVVLAGILLGFLIGATAAWLSQGRWRRKARRGVRDVATLQRDIGIREAQRENGQPAPGPPAVPSAPSAPSAGQQRLP